jgi:TonB family protein
MTLMPIVSLLVMLTSSPAGFQAARDTPPPAAESASRERELRLTIATGTATREKFVELALLLIRQHRFDDAIVALRGAAASAAPRFAEPFEAAVTRLQAFRVGDNIRTPIKITDAKPVYPPIAQSARIQGAVILEALIDDQGNLVNARVVRSIPLLDAAALDAVSKWKYTPADLDGRLVAVVMTVTVNFMLQ